MFLKSRAPTDENRIEKSKSRPPPKSKKERVKAGIAQAKLEGRSGGRPLSAALKISEIQKLAKQGLSKSEIARKTCIGRTSVRRLLEKEIKI